MKINEFIKKFEKVDFSKNVRDINKYLDTADSLAKSLVACKGNNEPILTAEVNGELVIVSGFRRAWTFLNADKITWTEKIKNEETGKSETVEVSPDFSACEIKIEHLGKISESDYFKRLCNHTLTVGLDRYGQVQTVERLYRELRGKHTACKQIQDSTGLKRGIVTQAIKAIELDTVSPGFLKAYIDKSVTTQAMGEIFPKLNKANEFSGKVRSAMLDEIKTECKKAVKSSDNTEKPEKALTRKEILALRDTVKPELVGLIEYIAGCKEASIKDYLK